MDLVDKLNMAEVKVYVTPFCGYCSMALRLLRQKGVEPQVQDVMFDESTRAWLRSTTGRYTVPQVFIDGRSVGGYTDILALDRAGKLDELLFPTDQTA